MRKLSLVLLFFLVSWNAVSQIEVKKDSFKEVEGFVNINIDKQYDDNDKPYSVLKIKTENINDKQRHELNFSGNAATFFEVEYKDGEVWLYISYYATYIKISHKDLSSTEFWFPFEMKPKCGYEIVLVNKSSRVDGFGTLKLTTIPENGATIVLDDISLRQQTPYYNDLITAGRHEITVSKERYKSVTKIVDIKEGTIEDVIIDMPINVALITLKADANTDIYIDGNMVSTGTWMGELISGQHEILYRKNYHTPVSETIIVEANLSKEYELLPIPINGDINIESEPNGASVYLDDIYCGTTPLTLNSVLIGPHELRIDKTGFMASKRSIVVESNNVLSIKEKLRKGLENKSFTVSGVTFEMVAVKGGVFNMGSQTTFYKGENYDLESEADESPLHEVEISDYYIGKFEVTQELWAVVMEKNPTELIDDNYPVNYVNIYDAMDFCNKLSVKCGMTPCYLSKTMVKIDENATVFRLPTEEQWEFAARGGLEKTGYKYSGSNDLSQIGWYNNNSSNRTHPVGLKSPNELGIYDMSGNVKEWCESKKENYNNYTSKNKISSASTHRVIRGGCFNSSQKECRVSKRDVCSPSKKDAEIGFRIVLQQ